MHNPTQNMSGFGARRAARSGVAAPVVRVAAVLAGVHGALAVPPPGGGGTGGGTIFYLAGPGLNSMASDGSGQAPLPPGVSGEPGHALHGPGGHRWFLYADGELFAARSDGAAAVQLTNSFDGIAVNSGARWAKNNPATTAVNEADSFLSYVGSDAGGNGIYRASVAFDSAGTPSLSGPSQLVLAVGAAHDWAPDGNRLVYDFNGLYIHAIGGPTTPLTMGRAPEWSPTGAKIAFERNVGIVSDLCAINPDGSGLQTLVQGRRHTANWRTTDNPHWSPTGTHLTYQLVGPLGSGIWDVWRVQAGGGGAVRLTGGNPVAWR